MKGCSPESLSAHRYPQSMELRQQRYWWGGGERSYSASWMRLFRGDGEGHPVLVRCPRSRSLGSPRSGVSVMSASWTVRDRNGELLACFACASPLEVARKVVPGHYDAFRLHVSSSYRELFDRALQQILRREDWQIVQMKVRAGTTAPAGKRSICVQADRLATDDQ